MSRQGFLIQASVRPRSRAAGPPVLQLYGRLAEGQTFLVCEDRERSYFFIRTEDGERAGEMLRQAAAALAPTTRQTLLGEPVTRVELATPAIALAEKRTDLSAWLAVFPDAFNDMYVPPSQISDGSFSRSGAFHSTTASVRIFARREARLSLTHQGVLDVFASS